MLRRRRVRMFDGEDDAINAECEAETQFPPPDTSGFFELDDWMVGPPAAATRRGRRFIHFPTFR